MVTKYIFHLSVLCLISVGHAMLEVGVGLEDSKGIFPETSTILSDVENQVDQRVPVPDDHSSFSVRRHDISSPGMVDCAHEGEPPLDTDELIDLVDQQEASQSPKVCRRLHEKRSLRILRRWICREQAYAYFRKTYVFK